MRYFEKMKQFHLSPNRITYNSMMDLAVKVKKMPDALHLIEQMNKDDILPDSYTYSIILNGLKINNSSKSLVQNCLRKIKMIIEADEIKIDQILFNSILDVSCKYDLISQVEDFYQLMIDKNVPQTPQSYGILIQAYAKSDRIEQAFDIFEKMINSGMKVREITYGLILDACTKTGKMNLAIKMYNSL